MVKNQKKMAVIVISGVAVLAASAMFFQSKSNQKNNQSVQKTVKTIDGKEIPEMEITQKSDGNGKTSPVSVQTDGTVDVNRLKGYAEGTKKDEKAAENRIQIKSIGSYSGPYVEDGTNEQVKNVLAIVVTNTSGEFLQYSEITMKNGDARATFALSNLPAGASALVLAKDRVVGGDDWTYEDDITAYIKKAELHEDKFSWEAGNNLLVLNNKSNDKYSKVHVYYKNTQDGIYIGGITYRIAFENLEAGEKREKLSKHFDGNNSHVMMIDYIDDEKE